MVQFASGTMIRTWGAFAVTTIKKKFTFRKAFLTPGQVYATPDKGDKVWWLSAPDNRDPQKTMAIRVVRDQDLVGLPEVADSIRSGKIDADVLRLRE